MAALLLRLQDPNTGAPLPDELLAGEFGVFFTAGIESAGHAITWTLCALHQIAPFLLLSKSINRRAYCLCPWLQVPVKSGKCMLPARRRQGLLLTRRVPCYCKAFITVDNAYQGSTAASPG